MTPTDSLSSLDFELHSFDHRNANSGSKDDDVDNESVHCAVCPTAHTGTEGPQISKVVVNIQLSDIYWGWAQSVRSGKQCVHGCLN